MKLEDAKILIGDDSVLARKQLKDILSSLGGRNFLDASNGQEVIDIYKEQSPEVVFLDIVMPVKDGNTAIAEIMEYDPKADIIIVSSVGTQSQLKQAIQLGAKDFLQKPLNRRQIESILNNRFEGR